MRFRTVKDILDWSQAFHAHLADQYDSLAAGHEQDRVGMLLTYLSDHQKMLKEAISEYETDAADGLLKTWYDEEINTSLPDSLDALRDELAANDTGKLLTQAIAFHDYLTAIYKSLADKSPNRAAQALFSSLASMEHHEQLRLARDALRLEDY